MNSQPCKHGSRCTRGKCEADHSMFECPHGNDCYFGSTKCRFKHTIKTESQVTPSDKGKSPCNFRNKCKSNNCPNDHSMFECLYGEKCYFGSTKCKFKHTAETRSQQVQEQLETPAPLKTTVTLETSMANQERMPPCKLKSDCVDAECQYDHTVFQCKLGVDCPDLSYGCKFTHAIFYNYKQEAIADYDPTVFKGICCKLNCDRQDCYFAHGLFEAPTSDFPRRDTDEADTDEADTDEVDTVVDDNASEASSDDFDAYDENTVRMIDHFGSEETLKEFTI